VRDHCCDAMRTLLEVMGEPMSVIASDRPVVYDPVFDEYRLVWSNWTAERALIVHCPWCGVRLPSSKRARWFAELDRLGLRPDDPDLPARLKTDAWWSD
jgi:hypothetical protein